MNKIGIFPTAVSKNFFKEISIVGVIVKGK